MITAAIIIARAGSKGIPNKAMATVGGRPLVEHAIAHADVSALVDWIAITSDGQDILDAGRHAGIRAYLRPPGLASDSATVDAAARHGVESLEHDIGARVDRVAILYGNVLRPPQLMDRAIGKLMATGCDSVQGVYPVGKTHPYWMKTLDGDRLGMYQPNTIYRRQDLPPVYMLDGGVIAVTRASLFNFDPTGKDPHRFLGTDRRAIITQPGEVIDIDTPDDLARARAVYGP